MNTTSNAAADAAQTDDAEQYLTFVLGTEEYAVEILRVEGIQGWEAATPIPNSPDYVLGVTNLRGAVVPIIDLRRRFELDNREFSATTVVIIVRIESPSQDRIVGMVVDGVSEVCSVENSELQPTPDFGGDVDTRFIKGLATVEDRMLILLEIDALLNDSIGLEVSPEDVKTDLPVKT